jgi:uncharacterized protein YdaU (DUF1376 family)
MQGKSPAFQFYAADYLADENVQLLTLEEEGAYIRLLAYCWREGSIPADFKSLSRMCKNCSEEVLTAVQPLFTGRGKRLVHPRLILERKRHENYIKQQRAKGIASGNSRASKNLTVEPQLNHGSVSVGTESKSSSSSSTSVTTKTPLPPINGGLNHEQQSQNRRANRLDRHEGSRTVDVREHATAERADEILEAIAEAKRRREAGDPVSADDVIAERRKH